MICSVDEAKMISSKRISKMDVAVKLSTLWLFATLNYLYCDVAGLMDPHVLNQYVTGTVNGMHIDQGFLLYAAILIEIPIAMVLLSRFLNYKANRWANVIAGIVMTVVQIGTLTVSPAGYYLFFSAIEIATTVFIVWTALRWTESQRELLNADTS
jgi:hypothetical protein